MPVINAYILIFGKKYQNCFTWCKLISVAIVLLFKMKIVNRSQNLHVSADFRSKNFQFRSSSKFVALGIIRGRKF